MLRVRTLLPHLAAIGKRDVVVSCVLGDEWERRRIPSGHRVLLAAALPKVEMSYIGG